MAAQSRGSVNVLVHTPNDSFEAMAPSHPHPAEHPQAPTASPRVLPELSNTALGENRAFPTLSDKWCQLPVLAHIP
jgi:hypothetical protein